MRISNKKPLKIISNIYKLIKAGYNPILVSPSMMLEEVYVFETELESKEAYNKFELSNRSIQAWWYSLDDFIPELKKYEKDINNIYGHNDFQINLYPINMNDEFSKKLKECLDSEDTKQYFEKIRNREMKVQEQLSRFHSKCKSEGFFENFVEKVLSKYNSNEYKDRWFLKGIMPEEYLYDFLYEYAVKYGKHIDEWGDEYLIGDYLFELTIGQGYYINITRLG